MSPQARTSALRLEAANWWGVIVIYESASIIVFGALMFWVCGLIAAPL
jgi:hypothetical protein